MAEKVTIKPKKIIVSPEDIYLGLVKKSGGGAVISFKKKHIDEEAYIILKEKCQLKE